MFLDLTTQLMAQFPACPHAVALLVDIYSQGSQEDVSKAKEVCCASLLYSVAGNVPCLQPRSSSGEVLDLDCRLFERKVMVHS